MKSLVLLFSFLLINSFSVAVERGRDISFQEIRDFTLVGSLSTITGLKGRWVLDGPRTCASGTKINDVFFSSSFRNYQWQLTEKELILSMEVSNISHIDDGGPCHVSISYTYITSEGAENLRTLPTISRKFNKLSSQCADDKRMVGRSVTVNYLAAGDSLKTFELMTREGAQCPKGDAIVTHFTRVKS